MSLHDDGHFDFQDWEEEEKKKRVSKRDARVVELKQPGAGSGISRGLEACFRSNGDLELEGFTGADYEYWRTVDAEDTRRALAALLTKRSWTVSQLIENAEKEKVENEERDDLLSVAISELDQPFEAVAGPNNRDVVLIGRSEEHLATVRSPFVHRLTLRVLRDLFFDGTFTSDTEFSEFMATQGIQCGFHSWYSP